MSEQSAVLFSHNQLNICFIRFDLNMYIIYTFSYYERCKRTKAEAVSSAALKLLGHSMKLGSRAENMLAVDVINTNT